MFRRCCAYKIGSGYISINPFPLLVILTTPIIGVDVLCKMTSDLRRCPLTEFQKKRKPSDKWCGMGRKKYYEALYAVNVVISTDLQFEMKMNNRVRSDLLKVSWDALGDARAG